MFTHKSMSLLKYLEIEEDPFGTALNTLGSRLALLRQLLLVRHPVASCGVRLRQPKAAQICTGRTCASFEDLLERRGFRLSSSQIRCERQNKSVSARSLSKKPTDLTPFHQNQQTT